MDIPNSGVSTRYCSLFDACANVNQDKFNYRFVPSFISWPNKTDVARRDISRIIKAMWENPMHRQAFVTSAKYVDDLCIGYFADIRSRQDFEQFIRFVNMLMSDTTFHLEESLTGLAKIHQIIEQKADTAAWEALEQNERQDLESQLRQTEGQVPWHTSMGLDHVELMRDFTATAKESFVAGEIVDRLAAVRAFESDMAHLTIYADLERKSGNTRRSQDVRIESGKSREIPL